jgi:putative aminopeptidase FrvX
MSDDLIQEIQNLADMVAVSSREERVRSRLKDIFAATKYKCNIDNIGNFVLVHPDQEPSKKTVLLFAHMDEIGFIVRKIEKNGFIRYERLGGVNTQILPGTRVVFDGKKGLVEGVIGTQAHHFMPAENKFVVPPISKQYIDIGADTYDEVIADGIDVGTLAALSSRSAVIHDQYIRGKSMDNRAAVGVLEKLALELENKPLQINLIFAFPVMEEYNIRGLMPVYRKYKPDIAIGLDVTPACDTPDLDYNDIALGKGPAICCMNFHGGGTLAGVLPDSELFTYTEEISAELGIPLQKEVSPGIITENAFGVFENEEGIRILNLSIPTRYTHSPFETVSISDIEQLKTLLEKMIICGFGKITFD